jgi:phenylacetate-CoA ligase
MACAAARAPLRSTSGTTGEPLVFGKDRFAAKYMDAAMHQVYGWYGIRIGDREGRFWGRAISARARLRQRIKDWLLNRRRLSAFQMDDENCARFWQTLQRFRPHYFYCYPNAVFEFADYLRRTGQPGHQLGLKAIICTGEVLFPHHVALLREVFRCPVVNEYGSTENGILAFECPEGNMHVLAQNIHLEIVDDDGNPLPPGASGRILVTELHSTDVPFIRYALSDTGALSPDPCACGRAYPVLTLQSGRIDSFIVTPAGKKVYDAVLAYAFKHAFRKFRGYQRRRDLLEVEYVPNDACSAKVLDGLRRTLNEYLGADMLVEFKQVEAIQLSKSGKAQYFVSELPAGQSGK